MPRKPSPVKKPAKKRPPMQCSKCQKVGVNARTHRRNGKHAPA